MNEKNEEKNSATSREAMQQCISSMFPDCVILDKDFNFISVSKSVLDSTSYTNAELLGRSISCFSYTHDLKELLKQKLTDGNFEEHHIDVKTKCERKVAYSISGCNLGMLAGSEGLLIFRFRNMDEINLVHETIESKTVELDRFVYLSAHALRGPLATIKGLVNIAKVSAFKEDLEFIMSQIEMFTEKLDDKLHRLIYFAESDKAYEYSVKPLSLTHLYESLSSCINEGVFDFPVTFEYQKDNGHVVIDNGEVILALLRNIVTFFEQQKKHVGNRLTLDIHRGANAVEMVVRAKGFYLDEPLRDKLKNINFGYSEILNHPELINCYAAKKIMFRLKGNIQFELTTTEDIVVLMTCPHD